MQGMSLFCRPSLERRERLDLTEAQILTIAGPATDEIDGDNVWMFTERDLFRLAWELFDVATPCAQAKDGARSP